MASVVSIGMVASREGILALEEPGRVERAGQAPSQSTLALVCSNAYLSTPWHRLGPFEYECRFRSISAHTQAGEPAERHLNELDRAQVEVQRLFAILGSVRSLVDYGRLGGLSSRHLSLSGAVVTPRSLIAATRRTALPQLAEDQVDVALLVPT